MLRNSVPRLHVIGLGLATSLLAVGCGEDLVDGDFGGVDLSRYFFDTGGTPENYVPLEAWLDGQRAYYYDFGKAAAIRDTPDDMARAEFGLGDDDDVTIPKVAPVNPMYFFFDSNGNPMFSAPVRETKSGRFFMPGGFNVRNPNPKEDADRRLAYPVRERSLLTDSRRKVADYQRPIIDVIMDFDLDERVQKYSGLWEFVAVKAPPGYKPEDIKSWETLEKGWDFEEGEFDLQFSGHVINCPLVDSRSLVIPFVSAYTANDLRIPQPMVELWYRRKRVNCFLVNGWETLGLTKADSEGQGNDSYELYAWNQDAARVGTIDTDRFVQGEGRSQRRQVVSPMGRVFIPRITARSSDFWILPTGFNSDITRGGFHVTAGAPPKQKKGDPPGYRPVRWWWNINVLDTGGVAGFNTQNSFEVSKLNSLDTIDDSQLSANGGRVINLALTGRGIGCAEADRNDPDSDPCKRFGLVCGIYQQDDQNPICAPRKVRYGSFCAPTIASCRDKINQAVAQNGQVSGDVVETWFFLNSTVNADMLAQRVPSEWIDGQKERDIVVSAREPYTCRGSIASGAQFSGMGHCFLSCAGGFVNEFQGQETELTFTVNQGGRDVEVKQKVPLDSRCGGALMPGYRCLPITDELGEKGGSFCARYCDPALAPTIGDALCRIPTKAYLSDELAPEDQSGFDISQNTFCQHSALRSVDNADRDAQSQPGSNIDFCEKPVDLAPFPGE